MAEYEGYYSLIQFCPSASRLEAVNVGLVLFVPELGFSRALTTQRNTRVRRLFGRTGFDRDLLEMAKESIVARIEGLAGQIKDAADFETFIGSRGNALYLTPARGLRVSNPQQDLQRLFEELVDVSGEVIGTTSMRDPLREILHEDRFHGRIQFKPSIRLSKVDLTIHAPYGYQNGSMNLIKPHCFVEGSAAIKSAMTLAVEGDLLAKDGGSESRHHRLIVVATYDEKSASRLRHQVESVLKEYQVRTVGPESLGAFVQEIEREAHRTKEVGES